MLERYLVPNRKANSLKIVWYQLAIYSTPNRVLKLFDTKFLSVGYLKKKKFRGTYGITFFLSAIHIQFL